MPATWDEKVLIVDDEGQADKVVFVVDAVAVSGADALNPQDGDTLSLVWNDAEQKWEPDLNAGGGSDPDALPAGVPFTTTTMTNPYSGEGDIEVVVVPVPDPADSENILAVACEGDTFPRLLLFVNGDGQQGLYFGDGTVSPTQAGSLAGNQYTVALGAGAKSVYVDATDGAHANDDFWFSQIGDGPIVRSPDGTNHRIKVANGGALSTEVVA